MKNRMYVFGLLMTAVLLIACNPIKTEATVDVAVVDQAGKAQVGVMVGRFNNSSSAYLSNADLTGKKPLRHMRLVTSYAYIANKR